MRLTHHKNHLHILLFIGLLPIVSPMARAQQRGDDLFNALRSRNLMQLQGESQIEWLPDGQSYLTSKGGRADTNFVASTCRLEPRPRFSPRQNSTI
jgi:hypothetical protein